MKCKWVCNARKVLLLFSGHKKRSPLRLTYSLVTEGFIASYINPKNYRIRFHARGSKLPLKTS
jgi:hypothetical protein